MKPRIILGNLITFTAGFLLAAKGQFSLLLFFSALLGLTCIIASACIFNNVIDRRIDRLMKRTKNRSLVTGLISPQTAVFLASLFWILGNLLLLQFTNFLTVALAEIGFFVYVLLYSLWKSRTIYGTAIGRVSGAIPPVVGYCSVSNQFDAGALIFFVMMILWQMPHFFSIALMHLEDYVEAKIPVLPAIKGISRTKVHMLLYILLFIPTATLLTFFHYTGFIYLIVTLVLSLSWLILCLRGFTKGNEKRWAHRMLQISLLVITGISLIIPFDRTS